MCDVAVQTTNNELAEWLEDATPEEIGLALEVGYRNVPFAKSLRPVFVSSHSTVQVEEKAVRLGQQGEERIEKLLQQRYEVQNTTGQGHQGDLSLQILGLKIIVEVKNYSNPVPYHTVEKFYKDLEATSAQGGIFVSLQTEITGITKDFCIRQVNCGSGIATVAFICSNNDREILTAVSMVAGYVKNIRAHRQEIYDSDLIRQTSEKLTGVLDEMSLGRVNWQKTISDSMSKLMKSTTNIIIPESHIRELRDSLTDETYNPDKEEKGFLQKFTGYKKLNETDKQRLTLFVQTVDELPNASAREFGEVSWKCTAKKMVHLYHKLQAEFTARGVEIGFPIQWFPQESIGDIVIRLNGCITDKIVKININHWDSILLAVRTHVISTRV